LTASLMDEEGSEGEDDWSVEVAWVPSYEDLVEIFNRAKPSPMICADTMNCEGVDNVVFEWGK